MSEIKASTGAHHYSSAMIGRNAGHVLDGKLPGFWPSAIDPHHHLGAPFACRSRCHLNLSHARPGPNDQVDHRR